MVQKKDKKSETNTPLWEWIFAAIGAVLILAATGTFIYRGATQTDSPAHFSFRTGEVSVRDGSYAVPFSVKNLGTQTAAALTVEGVLKRGEESVETSTVTIAYVPANAERDGVLIFIHDPAPLKLQLRAAGYEKP